MIYGSLATFHVPDGNAYVPIPKSGKDTVQKSHPVIAQLLLPAVFAKLWNAWLTTDSFGTLKEKSLSLPHYFTASVKI